MPAIERKHHKSKRRVVGNIAMRREDMHAFEKARRREKLLKLLSYTLTDVRPGIKSAFAILHLTTEVCSGVKPEPRPVGFFVARAVQVV